MVFQDLKVGVVIIASNSDIRASAMLLLLTVGNQDMFCSETL
jgi:hypothetical protein